MALSNWLTRDEWNAVFFVGLKEKIEGKPVHNLSNQLQLGIGALHRAGYVFQGIKSTAEGEYEKVMMCCDGNENILVEVMTQTLDVSARARELLVFAESSLPTMNFDWLRELIDEETQ